MKLLDRMRLIKAKRQRGDFGRDDTAAAAVEFAMVAPVFFLMLGVILETGLMMFTEYVLQTSVQEAARLVRTGQAQEQKMTPAKFKTAICDLAKLVINCQGGVTVYMNAEIDFKKLAEVAPAYLSIGPSGATPGVSTNECGNPEQAVAIIATYDWNFAIPYFMSFMGNLNGGKTRRLAGFAMFKNEPFPVVAGNVCTS